MKIIAFIGSQCSGKTTKSNLLNQVLTSLEYNVVYLDESARKCPYPINEKSDIRTQRWIFETFKKQYDDAIMQKPDFIIMDRCVLDHVPYTVYLQSNGRINLDNAMDLIDDTILYWNRLNIQPKLFYCNPLPLKDDGIRSTDKKFQLEIDNVYKEVLDMYRIRYEMIK